MAKRRRGWEGPLTAMAAAGLAVCGLYALELAVRRLTAPAEGPLPLAVTEVLRKDGAPPRPPAALRRRPGVPLIAVVGESSAEAVAQELIAADWRGGRFEVVDGAVAGGSLGQVIKAEKRLRALAPDVLVVIFGHNMMYVDPPSRLATLLSKSATARALEKLHRDGRGRRLAEWEEFLRGAARRAKAGGSRLIVAALQGNLWFPPESEDGELEDPRYLKALALRLTARKAEAAAALEALAQEKPSAFREFQLGEWLYEDGRYAEAYARLVRARDLDPRQDRVSGAANGIVRRLAAEEGFEVLDLEALYDGMGRHGVPGWDVFRDHCHPQQENWAVDALMELIGGAPGPHRPRQRHDRRGRFLEALRRLSRMESLQSRKWMGGHGYGLQELIESGAAVDAEDVLRSVEAGSFKGRPRALLLCELAAGCARARAWDEADALNREAARADPGSPRPRVQRALWELGRGRRAAAKAALEEALALAPDDAAARVFLDLLSEGGK
jgi:tetratricopeptide (TPR) repeat protein